MLASRGISLALLLSLGGCAGLDVDDCSTKETDESAEGVRYYMPSPYVLVHTDNEGGLTSQLIYLPDLTRKMSADPYAYLASNKTTLEFRNGVLVTSSTASDGTAVPKAIVSLLEKTAAAAAGAFFNAPAGSTPVPAPSLFKVVRCEHGKWLLVGGAGDTPITVTVPQ